MAGNRKIYDTALNEANSAAWDQQWDLAIAGYAQALDEFPDDSSVMSSLGLALLAQNKAEQALAVYQRAAQLNPDDPLPLEKCAEILHRLNRLPEAGRTYYFAAEAYVSKRDVGKAIENWTRAITLDSDNLQAHSRLALAYERTNRNQDASSIYVSIARLLQKRGELQKALQAAQRSAQLDAQNRAALQAVDLIQRGAQIPEPERSRISMAAMPTRSAAESFAPMDLMPETPVRMSTQTKSNPLEDSRQRALGQMADLMFDMGDMSDTEDDKSPFKKNSNDPFRKVSAANRLTLVGLLTQGIEAQSKGDINTALSFFDKAQRTGMEHAALNILIGGGHFSGERYKEALKQFQLATGHPDYAAGAYYGLGLCHGREERMRDAVINLLRCLKYVDQQTVSRSQADSIAALYDAFEENLGNGQTNDDLTRIAETLVSFLSGVNWQDRVQQARLQLNQQQENGILAPLAEMISIPGADRVMESLALIERYSAKGKFDSALDEAQRAAEYSPTYLPIHMKMAEILAKSGRGDDAIIKYSIVAELYRVRGDEARAVTIYQQIAQLAPMDINIRNRLTALFTTQGKIGDAVQATLETAEIHLSLADMEMARQTLNSALLLAQRPGVDKAIGVNVMHKIAELDMQRLDWRQAVKTYEQLKNQNPADDKARLALITLHFKLANPRQALTETDDMLRYFLPNAGLPKSIQLLEALMVDYSSDINLRQRITRLYQQAGRKDDAIAQLDAIADTFHQSGNTADAARTIQAIIDMQPDNVEDYRQVLEQLQSQV
jgi:tetratricopeptide (TPR) repeat protein